MLLQSMLHDLRYALRQLRRAPGFALTVVLTLALSVGAATAVFCVVDTVILRPLPYARPGQDRFCPDQGPQRIYAARLMAQLPGRARAGAGLQRTGGLRGLT